MTTHLKNTLVAASPWEQATLLINGKKVEWRAEFVLLRGQENAVTVSAPPEIAGAINLGLVEGGGLTIVASPKFDGWVAPVNGKFNWKITPGAGKSGRITLVFFSREVLVPWEHRSLVISSNLADEVRVLLGGVAIPPNGADFMGEKTQTLTLDYLNADVLKNAPLALDAILVTGLVPGDVKSVPTLKQLTTKHEWYLTGGNKNGTFRLKLSTEHDLAVMETPTNRLQTSEIFEIWFDGVKRQPGLDLYPPLGKELDLVFRPTSNIPTTRHTLSVVKEAPGGMTIIPTGNIQNIGTVWKLNVRDNNANSSGFFLIVVTFEAYPDLRYDLRFNLDF